MDSKILANLDQHIREKLPHIRSFLVVRHGYVVFEKYRQGLTRSDYHQVASVTKSFTSALIGIALKEGYLRSLDQKIVDFFPEYATPSNNAHIKEITIRHLLTMTSGFNWNDGDLSWTSRQNWREFAIGRQISNQPGIKFNYDTPASHLLSGILTKSTRMQVAEFAEKYLFTPLGISKPQWPADAQGDNYGGFGLSLRTREMAKLGYLYLNQGKWGGKQIIPTDFVQASTQKQSEGGFPEGVNYGYLWWVGRDKGHAVYFAGGFGGQFIYVVPGLDILVVITSDLDRPHIENRSLVGEFVIPAISK